jgi:hypothetical protein
MAAAAEEMFTTAAAFDVRSAGRTALVRRIAAKRLSSKLAGLLAFSPSHAEVTSVEVTSRQPWVGGQSFDGDKGTEVIKSAIRGRRK